MLLARLQDATHERWSIRSIFVSLNTNPSISLPRLLAGGARREDCDAHSKWSVTIEPTNCSLPSVEPDDDDDRLQLRVAATFIPSPNLER